MNEYDAIIVGSGPNGLSAGITLALKGLSVLIVEDKKTVGGGCRSADLTLPGFTHDVCSAIYPLGVGSPFFKSLPLQQYGLEWLQPLAPLAHPFDDGSCILLERSIDGTCNQLGEDAEAYKYLMEPITNNWPYIEDAILGPLTLPKRPIAFLRFALKALRSAKSLSNAYFRNPKTKGFFAGIAAHSFLPLDKSTSAAVGLVLAALGHIYGWPMAKGGSQSIIKALSAYFQDLGGEIQTESKVRNLQDLPPARAILFDLTPKQIIEIAGERLSTFYKCQLEKYRYGPGVFKIDFALNSPIPWTAKEALKAGTVHIGGSFDEIAKSEKSIWENQCAKRPFILLAQQTLFDQTRAPEGKHTAWAYCHVPSYSTVDMTDSIISQIERYAPGFRDCILAKHTMNTHQIYQYNANYIGGDIIGGVQDIWQQFTRPVIRWCPYTTTDPMLYICSSSTPPGGGVHGMCGHHAAQVVLNKIFS